MSKHFYVLIFFTKINVPLVFLIFFCRAWCLEGLGNSYSLSFWMLITFHYYFGSCYRMCKATKKIKVKI